MNDDDRLREYLAGRAHAISLPPGDPATAVRRGNRRRNRRRAAIGCVALAAVGASTFAVVDRDEPTSSVESGLAAPAVVASPLDWTVVAPASGLGYSRSTAIVDGSLYSLSTAPGPYDAAGSFEPTLYRSDDGAGWVEVSLPSGLRPSSLAATDGNLYAIGTAPAGGGTGRDLVVATSTDGAASWASVTLPAEIAALEARHPGQITISQPSVAATDATHLVASVVVTANPDVKALLPDLADPDAGWEITPEGVTLYELDACQGRLDPRGCDPSAPTTIVAGEAGAVRMAGDPEDGPPKVRATYTWEELGLDPELRDLIRGRTYVYASDDGATFEPAALPDGADGWGGHLLATEDGYRLFLGESTRDSATTSILRSEDGHTWTAAGTLPGSPQTAGLLGGRPAVALFGFQGGVDVFVNQADGGWAPLDLLSIVDGADDEQGIGEVAFGPLGVVATVWTEDTRGGHIVHSLDGSAVSAIALADHLDEAFAVMGVSVTADAVLVRVDGPADDDPTTPPTQQVLVGTPR